MLMRRSCALNMRFLQIIPCWGCAINVSTSRIPSSTEEKEFFQIKCFMSSAFHFIVCDVIKIAISSIFLLLLLSPVYVRSSYLSRLWNPMNKHKLVRPPLSHKKMYLHIFTEQQAKKRSKGEIKIVQFFLLEISYCIKYLSREAVGRLSVWVAKKKIVKNSPRNSYK